MSNFAEIPETTLAYARRLLANKASWNQVSRLTGVGRDVIRCRLDPEYAKTRRVHGSTTTRYVIRQDKAEIEAIQDAVPRDTRGLTARMMGDPLTGRSALDLRRKMSTSPNPEKIVVAGYGSEHIIQDRHSNPEAVD